MSPPDFSDDTTMDPRTAGRSVAPTVTLRVLYDGGSRAVSRVAHALRDGEVPIGRGVDSVFGVRLDADPRISRLQATLAVRGVDVRLRNESKNGTSVNGRPVDEVPLRDGDVVRAGDTFLLLRLLPAGISDAPSKEVLGCSPAAMSLRSTIHLVGPTPATVLLLGETGAGKEVAARALHDRSGRKGPFLAVNASAIPDTLAESQLFGHLAGSFTGARGDHPGFFRQAQGGTLFLDEVGDLPVHLQPKLLRVLDERKVLPVGATLPVPVDVRVVAATNRDLEEAVLAGSFRGDLFARLAEISVEIPPLRERREDVLLLLGSALGAGAPPLSPELVEALLLHPWPFNVRELFKVATELSVRGQGKDLLELDLVKDRLRPLGRKAASAQLLSREADDDDAEPPQPSAPSKKELPIPDREELLRLVQKHKGVIADVARATGRSRKQVYRWLERHGIDADRVRDES